MYEVNITEIKGAVFRDMCTMIPTFFISSE